MNKKFRESYKLFRKSTEGKNPQIMWSAGEMDKMSFIECWLVEGKGIVIYQVLPDGAGFNEYIALTATEKNSTELLNMVKSLVSSMRSNLPNIIQEEPEFEYFIKAGEELIDKITGVKLNKV